MATSVDVCVVSWRTPELLGRFLDSYKAVSKKRRSRLFVRVNDPLLPDETIVRKYAAIIDGHLSMGRNIGYARSVNLLAGMGDGDVLGIFNADARLTDDLWGCVEGVNEPGVGVLGPRLLDNRGLMTCGGGVVGEPDSPRFPSWRKRSAAVPPARYDALSVSGAAFFTPRKVWNELSGCAEYRAALMRRGLPGGGLLPTDHWYEETFYAYHARAHGYRVVYDGSLMLRHEVGASGNPPAGRAKVWRESRALFREMCDEVHGMERE